MAVLSDPDRVGIWGAWMQSTDCPASLTKIQLRAVVDALDDYWEASGATAANAAIPQPQRGILTPKQKAALLMRLLRRKYEVT